MKKKLVSLLLSLLLCLSLLPSQAYATDALDFVNPSAQIESIDSKNPDSPEPLIMPLADETPGKFGDEYTDE